MALAHSCAQVVFGHEKQLIRGAKREKERNAGGPLYASRGHIKLAGSRFCRPWMLRSCSRPTSTFNFEEFDIDQKVDLL